MADFAIDATTATHAEGGRKLKKNKLPPNCGKRAATLPPSRGKKTAILSPNAADYEKHKKTVPTVARLQPIQPFSHSPVSNIPITLFYLYLRYNLRPNARSTKDGFLPVLGAGNDVYISRTPVTNAQFGEFLKASGAENAKVAGGANHPAVNVSYADAVAFCKWMTKKDGRHTYRLPTETEWEFAAGHMPKDADFNYGERNGTSPVEAYQKTLSACGAVDMWGNCWEWTSTEFSKNGEKLNVVKGGAFDSKRTECRTELKGVGRNPSKGYRNVGFRVVRVD